MFNTLAKWAIQLIIGAFNCLPLKARRWLITSLIRVYSRLAPKFKAVARRNLELAFPNMPVSAREDIFKQSLEAFGRVFVDLARLPTIDAKWCQENLEFSGGEDLKYFRANYPGKGLIYATGHLGSFEMSACVAAHLAGPLHFVAREFKFQALDAWWNEMRESCGNKVIPRQGAFQNVQKALKNGTDVGILFDQNIKRQHAVFVDWFGRPAATTKIIALVSLKFKSPIVCVALVNLGGDKYRFEFEPCDCRDIYANKDIALDEKIRLVTERISNTYIELIKKYPGQWFWMHRRWRTTPEGVAEDFYN